MLIHLLLDGFANERTHRLPHTRWPIRYIILSGGAVRKWPLSRLFQQLGVAVQATELLYQVSTTLLGPTYTLIASRTSALMDATVDDVTSSLGELFVESKSVMKSSQLQLGVKKMDPVSRSIFSPLFLRRRDCFGRCRVHQRIQLSFQFFQTEDTGQTWSITLRKMHASTYLWSLSSSWHVSSQTPKR